MGEKPSLGLTLTEGSVSALFQLVSSGDKEFTAHMDVPTWRPHAPSSPHFKSMGPKNSKRPQACLRGLCRPLPSSILKRHRPTGLLGGSCSGVCEGGTWMWRLEWSRAAPHSEQRSGGWGEKWGGDGSSHTTMFPHGTSGGQSFYIQTYLPDHYGSMLSRQEDRDILFHSVVTRFIYFK